ncbi:GNAT family N-acetyltransferase [Candidatus Haliotispira prima]|uniref:GNAT family N-acetyltransferase n=1 Tax=Candidatus Haliotispira prima TaxID=3034016 RepID=A0ABY8MJG9_9SPIO|nr:GNAT family N-acetyltransferase [Candidatus Haliotispira prima]
MFLGETFDRGVGSAGLSVVDRVPENLLEGLRELEPEDYHKGYPDLCATLTDCPELSETLFRRILAERVANDWHTWVLSDENDSQGRLIATISLHLERKFYRGGRCVGHIEDVIVLPEYRKLSLGKGLVQFAIDKARDWGCYKVVLDCGEELEGFYGKAGLKHSNIQMATYF